MAVGEGDPLLEAVADALGGTGPGGAYACGEYVLESLAGRSPGGIMLACASVEDASMVLEGRTGWRRVPGSGGAVVLNPGSARPVTLVGIEGPGVTSHLAGAAFTVLAMGIDLFEPSPRTLIDPLGGLSDLRAGVLRVPVEEALFDDPSRCFLAAGLRARFGLEPDADTMGALRRASGLVGRVPPRRAWRVLSRLYSGTGLSEVSGFLRLTGALGALLPEVEAIYDVPQNYFHHLDVWGHTMETLDRLEEMMEEPASRFRAHSGDITRHLAETVEGGVDRRAFLAFAGLIHDLGKPKTRTVEPTGRIRFRGHQSVGAGLAGSVASRLGLGRRGTGHLRGIVGDHMRIGHLIKEGETTAARLKAAMEMGSHCVEVVLLSLADRLATRGEASTEEAVERYSRVASRVLADWFWLRRCPPLVDGRDVMVHAGVAPGPGVARALFEARVAQRECTVASRGEALEFLAPDFKGRMDGRGR